MAADSNDRVTKAEKRFHSVEFVERRCKGCTHCVRSCPAQAIRVRFGKAQINYSLCIDCGECILNCRYHAKIASTDSIEDIKKYKFAIAQADMALYGQFAENVMPNDIIWGLLNMGFHYVQEVARDTEKISIVMQEYLARNPGRRPLISSLCPVITRLVQIRFPDLLDLVVPVESITEISVKNIKEEIAKKENVDIKEIGAFYITPCPARVYAIRRPDIKRRSLIDHSIAISDIYHNLQAAIRNSGPPSQNFHTSTGVGMGWGALRGEMESINVPNSLTVDGLNNVVDILESLENGFLEGIDYLECRACRTGCVGGPLTINNRFLARSKIEKLRKLFPEGNPRYRDPKMRERLYERYIPYFSQRFPMRPAEPIDTDTSRAIEKMKRVEDIRKSLPGFDCGSCGAPSCRALAVDVVKGNAETTDCIFKLREKIEDVSAEFLKWTRKKPTLMMNNDAEKDKDPAK